MRKVNAFKPPGRPFQEGKKAHKPSLEKAPSFSFRPTARLGEETRNRSV
jgi:hypothetical protein